VYKDGLQRIHGAFQEQDDAVDGENGVVDADGIFAQQQD
jgi:hypothetical protein